MRPLDVPGEAIDQADHVLIAEIVEVERWEQQASEHVQRLADDMEHLVSSRGAAPRGRRSPCVIMSLRLRAEHAVGADPPAWEPTGFGRCGAAHDDVDLLSAAQMVRVPTRGRSSSIAGCPPTSNALRRVVGPASWRWRDMPSQRYAGCTDHTPAERLGESSRTAGCWARSRCATRVEIVVEAYRKSEQPSD